MDGWDESDPAQRGEAQRGKAQRGEAQRGEAQRGEAQRGEAQRGDAQDGQGEPERDLGFVGELFGVFDDRAPAGAAGSVGGVGGGVDATPDPPWPGEVALWCKRLDELMDEVAGLDLGDFACEPAGLSVVLRALEQRCRRVRALEVALAGQVDRHGSYVVDGHRSARAMLAHVANLSGAGAAQRVRLARTCRDVAALGEAFAAGAVSGDHAARVARLWANPRVRDALGDPRVEAVLVAAACRFDYDRFDRFCSALAAHLDTDGPEPAERDRGARMAKVGYAWLLEAVFGEAHGTVIAAVFDAFCDAERAADVADARQAKDAAGDPSPVEPADLARTENERRADALYAIFLAATGQGEGITVNVGLHMSTTDLLAHLERLRNDNCHTPHTPHTPHQAQPTHPVDEPEAGDPADPGDPDEAGDRDDPGEADEAGEADDLGDLDDLDDLGDLDDPVALAEAARRLAPPAGTDTGIPLHPDTVAGFALANHVRRVICDTDGTVLDYGRRQRLFTGAARAAIMALHPHCIWPGCAVPTRHCQTDHLQPWTAGGTTTPSNAAPLCGHHNRHKHTGGYTVRRNPDGTYRTLRPDGTII